MLCAEVLLEEAQQQLPALVPARAEIVTIAAVDPQRGVIPGSAQGIVQAQRVPRRRNRRIAVAMHDQKRRRGGAHMRDRIGKLCEIGFVVAGTTEQLVRRLARQKYLRQWESRNQVCPG